MSFSLETAANPEKLRRVAIDPISRVEGHGKVTILLDDNNKVHQVRLHIVEFRGFEKFIQGLEETIQYIKERQQDAPDAPSESMTSDSSIDEEFNAL